MEGREMNQLVSMCMPCHERVHFYSNGTRRPMRYVLIETKAMMSNKVLMVN